MKIKQAFLNILFVFFLGITSFSVRSGNIYLKGFESLQAAQLAQLVEESYQARLSNIVLQTKSWHDLKINEIESAFDNLSRVNTPIEDLIEIKYMVIHWRHRTAEYLLSQLWKIPTIRNKINNDERNEIYNKLLILNINFENKFYQKLLDYGLKSTPYNEDEKINDKNISYLQAGLIKIFTQNGKRDYFEDDLHGKAKKFALLAGPRGVLEEDIKEYKMLRFSTWGGNEGDYDDEFSKYEFEYAQDKIQNTKRTELVYRGLRFRSGDILEVHFNSHGDGLFSFIGEPRSYLSHMGILVFIKREGKIYPSVLEMSLLGIRAIPLSSYLMQGFTNYVEIYRAKEVPSNWDEKLNKEASKILLEEHGYDFNGNESERKYLSCPEVPNYLLERTGIMPVKARTHVPESLHQTLRRLGLYTKEILSPTDYIREGRFEYLGRVDNDDSLLEITLNQLFNSYIVRLFTENRVNPDNLPSKFSRVETMIRQFQYGTPLGYILRWELAKIGFLVSLFELDPIFDMPGQEQMPAGNPKTVALVAILDDEEGKGH